MAADSHHWDPMSLSEICGLFKDLSIPWWVAGGHAIDLFVGYQVREHFDIDILILRQDQLALQDYLEGWDLHKTIQPGLKPWPVGEYLEIGVNQVWCRRTEDSPWLLEVMLMDTENDRWFYRRVSGIGGPLLSLGHATPEGVRYLAPEIQLLFKAKDLPVAKDEADFDAALPLLGESEKEWLRLGLEKQFPNSHPWIERLHP
jgi:hypothetical protein